ncbi:MAG: glutaredoxin family protein [Trueperaceae bacterium]
MSGTDPARPAPDADTLTIYTTDRCGDCVATKRALDAAGVPFREVDITHDEKAARYVQQVNDGRRSVPTLAYGGTAVSLSNFSKRRLDAYLAQVGLRSAANEA